MHLSGAIPKLLFSNQKQIFMKRHVRLAIPWMMAFLLLFSFKGWGQEIFSTTFDNPNNWQDLEPTSWTGYNPKAYSEAGWYFHSTSSVRGTADESFGGSLHSFREREIFTVKNTAAVSGMTGFSFQLRDWMTGTGKQRALKLSMDGGVSWETIAMINKEWFDEYMVYQEFVYLFPDGSEDFVSDEFQLELDGGDNHNDGRINIGKFTALGTSNMVSTPVFSPNGGTFFSPVNVEISSATPNATVFYSTVANDGPWTEYTAPLTITETTTVWAYASADDMDDSSVSTATFTFPAIVEVADIATLRAGATDGTIYRLTGEALITAQDAFNNRKFIEDATGAILIFDSPGVIQTTYEIGDGIEDLTGTLSISNQMLRFVPVLDPGAASSVGNPLVPQVFEIDDLTSADQAKLVTIEEVTFITTGTFNNGQNYTFTDGINNLILRTDFFNVDYIGEAIPENAQNITGVILQFNDNLQIVPRNLADFEDAATDIVSATIDPTEVTIDDGDDVVTTITWNDATEVSEITVQLLDMPAFPLDEEDYTVTDHGDGTATLTIFTNGEDKFAGKDDDPVVVTVTISFDVGDDAILIVNINDFMWWAEIQVTESGTGIPIEGAAVFFVELDETHFTDEWGWADVPVEAGTYTLNISADGYTSLENQSITVTASFDNNQFFFQLESEGELPGSTCENPIFVDIYDAPLVDFQINSEPYGDHYSNNWIDPASSYLNGNDIVFQFTLTGTSFVNASIAGSWTGIFILEDCPDPDDPAERLYFAGSSSGGAIVDASLDAGTYFLIASTWPAPQFTDMTINLSALLITPEPTLVVSPTSVNFGQAAVDLAPNQATLSLSNLGLGDLIINDGDLVFTGADAGLFDVILPDGVTYPITIEFEETVDITLTFAPTAEGAANAALEISYNHPDNGMVSVPLSGSGYLPMAEFFENFDQVTPPALPLGWNDIVHSVSTSALVDTRTAGTPNSPPNHVSMYYGNDLNAQIFLVSPAVVNLEDSWVQFFAKMSVASHVDLLEVGYLTDPFDYTTFTIVETLTITGPYTQYTVEFNGDDKDVLPDAGYIGFRIVPQTTFRRLYLDDISYGEIPVSPVFFANKEEIDFGESIWLNTTATTTLQIGNVGVGVMTINETDINITGDDAAYFDVHFPDGTTWPLELEQNQTFTFQVSFTPTEAVAYSANLEIEDNIAGKAINTIPLLGSGYDPTITPEFVYDFLDVFPPTDWRRYIGLLEETSELAPTTANWVHGRFGHIGTTNNSARINIFGSTRRHWLATPPIDMGDGTTEYQLQFDLALTQYNQPQPGTMGPTHKFAVVISTDGGETWSSNNVLRMWTAENPISHTGELVTIDLSGYTGVVKVAFYGEATATGGDVDVFVTNVSVNELELYTATFVVEDEDGNPITDAVVTLNGETNAAGDYVFDDLLAGTYSWAVEHEDYFPESGEVTILDADVTVTVTMELRPEVPFIVSIEPVDDVTVEHGTSEADAIAALAATTTITDSDQVSHTVTLNWTIENYDAEMAGDYDATATFDLPDGVDQSDPPMVLEVTATVTVLPAPVIITDFPWLEDFEEVEFPPHGWLRFNVDGGGTQWVSSTAQNHTPDGNRSAFHNYSSVGYQDGWLVTPLLELPTEEMELRFWSYNSFPTWYEKNSVLVSTGSPDPADNDFVEVWTTEAVAASWVETVVDLEAYSGQSIYIAFRYEGDDAHGWYLDDVLVQETPEGFNVTFVVEDENEVAIPDAVVTFDGETFDAGEYVITGVEPGEYAWSVARDGYETATGTAIVVDADITVEVTLVEIIPVFTVTFEVEDEDGVAITDAIITFDGVTYDAGVYVFADLEAGSYDYSVVKAGYHTVVGVAEVVDADVTVNVVMLIDDTVVYNLPFLETFDGEGAGTPDTWLPDHWQAIDADGDGYNWYWSPGPGGENGQMRSQSYADGAALDVDNWLITPAINLGTIEGDEFIQLAWKVGPGASTPMYRTEHYSVMISTTDDELESFTQIFNETLEETHPQNALHLRTLDLSTYAGEVVYIAFRHHDSADNDRLLLDDVFVTVEEPTFTVTFNVHMHAADFDPETDIVYITGDILGWAVPGDDHENQVMEPTDDDPMVYTKTFQLTAGTYEYKYFLNAGWDGGEWTGGDNRVVVVDDDMVINNVFGDPTDETINVPELELVSISLYPNPAQSTLNIVSDHVIHEVRVIDLLGQIVHTAQPGSERYEMNVSSLRDGMYLIQIHTPRGVATQRVQVRK
jgi:hypothetical protein